jgi:hypothetical protein
MSVIKVEPLHALVDTLLCPECFWSFTHLKNIHLIDSESAKLIFGCERGHEFAIDFEQDKGETQISVSYRTWSLSSLAS